MTRASTADGTNALTQGARADLRGPDGATGGPAAHPATRALLEAVAARGVVDERFDAVCAYLASAFEGLLPFDRVAIATIEPDGLGVSLRGVWARGGDLGAAAPARDGDVGASQLSGSSLAAVRASGLVRIIDDLEEYLRTHPMSRPTEWLLREGYRSSLTCPLEAEGERAFGFLFFTSRTVCTYQPEHAELFSRLAREVSALLVQVTDGADVPTEAVIAALGQRLEALVRTAQAVHQEERLLARVVDRVNQGTRLDDILDDLYDSFSVLLPYDQVGFVVVEPDGRRARIRWARGTEGLASRVGATADLERTSLRAVAASGAPRILDNLPAYLRAHPNSDGTRWLVRQGLQSSLTFGLGHSRRPKAFLYFASKEPSAYGEAHVARLRQITRALSGVFEKAMLIDALRDANARSDALLAMLMPPSVAERLKAGEADISDQFEVTVLFADLVGFASWSRQLTPQEMVGTLREIYHRFDEAAERLGVYKLRTVGDSWLALAGLGGAPSDHPVAAARLALALRAELSGVQAPNGHAIEMRVGLHTGKVIAGVLGGRDLHYDAWGPALSVASRMESHSLPGRIRVSEETALRLPRSFVVTETAPASVKSLGVVRTLWLEREEPWPPTAA
jgi:class 3 adenylate cyclase